MDGSSRSTQSGGSRTQSELACNICLRRMPNSPVATYCGHVFCWPCLYRSWPQQGPGAQAGPAITKSCPVCGTAIRERFNIVPIYGYDNVASPRSGTERPTTTGTTTAAAAAAAAADTATSPRPTAAAAAPVSNTPIPPRPTAAAAAPVSNNPIPTRPTAAAVFTAPPHRPHSIAAWVAARAAARAAAAVAPNAAIPPRPAAAAAAVSSDTGIPPRPNPPARITQRQTQTDAARAPPARPLGPNRLGSLRNLASTIPRHGFLGEVFGFGAGDRLRPSSSPARNIGLGVASRSIRRRLNLRLNPRGMDGNDGNRFESHRARMDRVLNEILAEMGATLTEINALIDARIELEDDLI